MCSSDLNGSILAFSADGLNWSPIVNAMNIFATNEYLYTLAYQSNTNTVIAVSNSKVAYSTDIATWTSVTLTPAIGAYWAIYCEDNLIIYSNGGTNYWGTSITGTFAAATMNKTVNSALSYMPYGSAQYKGIFVSNESNTYVCVDRKSTRLNSSH